MRFLKGLLIALVVLAIAIVGVGYVLPDLKHVERSITVARAPAEVFPFVNSFKRFNEWSPWAEMDLKATYQISGPESGVGAKLAWQGDPKTVGTGSDEIVESVPNQHVKVVLDFGAQGKMYSDFDLKPEGAGTHVVWSLDSDAHGNLIARYFNALALDSMIGKDYEHGLAKLKAAVEAEPVAPPLPVEAPPSTAPAEALPDQNTPPPTSPTKTTAATG